MAENQTCRTCSDGKPCMNWILCSIDGGLHVACEPICWAKKKQLKKISQRELTKARDEVGARRHTIDISPRQWEAIQAGALHKTTLEKVFDHADLDILREYATPSNSKVISDAKKARIQSMKASGYTNAEIGEALGISASSVSKYANS